MGVSSVDKSAVIDKVVRNVASEFIAEVFIEELSFLIEDDFLDALTVQNHGMNARFESKDVLNVATNFVPVGEDFKENLVLHLSRNSIYHQLPEVLFHPLSMNQKSGNTKGVVEEIRNNRKREKENLDFFSFFDTELFKESVKINNRSLNFFFSTKSKEQVLTIIKEIVGTEIELSDASFYKLFLSICRAEFYKENLPELEKLISLVLELNVKMDYVPHCLKESPYAGLGGALLGVDFGLTGAVYSEIDDVKVTILLEKNADDFEYLNKNILLIKKVLSFFIISSRNIHVTYEANCEKSFVLSNGFLGYDSYLTTAKK